MPISTPITNPHSERVSKVASLAQRPVRKRTGEFLVEGPQSVRELVRFRPETVRDIYLTDEARGRWPEIADEALAADLYLHGTLPEVAARMSQDSQGVLAVARHSTVSLGEVDLSSAKLIAICDQVRDPGNVGTIIRAADAVGADAVVLTSGSVEVTSPKVVRSSAGSLFHLPIITGIDVDAAAHTLATAGITLLAADGSATEDVETSLRVPGRVAWIFGTEAQGLSERARTVADAVVGISMRGRAESLNVAMAATIALYRTAERQHDI